MNTINTNAVRDLAKAHIAAAFLPDVKSHHIINGHNTNLLEMAQILLPNYGKDYPIPQKAMPKWLLWLIGPFAGADVTRKMVSRNSDLPWRGDNSKSIKDLGMRYQPMIESMNDMLQLINTAYFRKA